MTATAAPIKALPDTGVFHVDTVHSTYTIDTGRRVIRREPMHDYAAPLVHDGEPVGYEQIDCTVDERMVVEYGDGRVRISTPVLGITPCEVEL